MTICEWCRVSCSADLPCIKDGLELILLPGPPRCWDLQARAIHQDWVTVTQCGIQLYLSSTTLPDYFEASNSSFCNCLPFYPWLPLNSHWEQMSCITLLYLYTFPHHLTIHPFWFLFFFTNVYRFPVFWGVSFCSSDYPEADKTASTSHVLRLKACSERPGQTQF